MRLPSVAQTPPRGPAEAAHRRAPVAVVASRDRHRPAKVGIKVSERTIQKYMRGVRSCGGGQSWATFLKNHAERMWVCDFIQTHDLLFRPVYAFFLVHLASRRVVHIAATRHPTQAWTAQQLRNATMDGEAPAILLRDRDDKFGPALHQGIGQRVPTKPVLEIDPSKPIEATSVLGGLHVDYRRAA